MNDQLDRCRIALKMLLSRGTGCQWSDVPDADVDACLAEADRLDSPELPDGAYSCHWVGYGSAILVANTTQDNRRAFFVHAFGDSDDSWDKPPRGLTNIRPLHADADELREKVKELQTALAAKPEATRELMADVEKYLRIARDCEAFTSLGKSKFDDLLRRVRAASDPVKPPMGTGLVDRCVKWLNECQGFTEKTELTRQKLLDDLAKVSDPQPGISREQAESFTMHHWPFINGSKMVTEVEFVELLLRELGTAPSE